MPRRHIRTRRACRLPAEWTDDGKSTSAGPARRSRDHVPVPLRSHLPGKCRPELQSLSQQWRRRGYGHDLATAGRVPGKLQLRHSLPLHHILVAGPADNERCYVPLAMHISAAQVGEEPGGQLMTGLLHSAGRLDLLQDTGRGGGADLPAGPAGDQAAARRAAGTPPGCGPGSGPGAAWITAPDRGVIMGPDLGGSGRAQRGDGHREGIVGVVLVRRPGGQLASGAAAPLTSSRIWPTPIASSSRARTWQKLIPWASSG